MFKPVLAKRQQMVQDIQSILRFWAICIKFDMVVFWLSQYLILPQLTQKIMLASKGGQKQLKNNQN